MQTGSENTDRRSKITSETTASPDLHLERLVDVGRQLGGMVSLRDLVQAVPRLACYLCDARGSLLLAVDGASTGTVAQYGRDLFDARSALDAPVRRAIEGEGASEMLFRAPDGACHTLALAPVPTLEATWALVVIRAGGEPSPRAVSALAALALMAGGWIGRAQANAGRAAQDPPAEPAMSPRAGNPSKPAARLSFEDVLGDAVTLKDCLDVARRAAAADMPILVTGETGTGKEMIAQAIHNASPRRAAPFVDINVAAIPRELLESELFGYERGAFTGARSAGKPGLFELAEDGTILLDEIGDMPLDLQVKLLRVLEERAVRRLGSTRAIAIRARTIATTHRDLRRATEEGRFRADLYYRLRGVHIRVPPLRERLSDLPRLVDACLRRVAARSGRPVPVLAPQVLAAYMEHGWPGNVRELIHLVEAEASLLPPGETIIRRLPTFQRAAPPQAGAPSVRPAIESVREGESLDDVERRTYEDALRRAGGNVSKAARALGVARGTFYNKMRRFGLVGAARVEED